MKINQEMSFVKIQDNSERLEIILVPRKRMAIRSTLFVLLMLIGSLQLALGQSIRQTENKADQTLRSNGRVNPSTLGMELSIPLGGYAGRAGSDKPLTLEYSSKVWGTWEPDVWETPLGTPVTDLAPKFSQGSVRGWTTSLQQWFGQN